jgi:hypothetical protein
MEAAYGNLQRSRQVLRLPWPSQIDHARIRLKHMVPRTASSHFEDREKDIDKNRTELLRNRLDGADGVLECIVWKGVRIEDLELNSKIMELGAPRSRVTKS